VLEAAAVLWLSLGVIRAVARVQGMRPGLLASGALVRQTATAMVAAGAMEALHDLAPSAAAAGVAQRVAGRLGQGAVNGFLTARLGVAALEATRPLPFRARPKPSAREILARSVTG
jgi:putative membrane protein